MNEFSHPFIVYTPRFTIHAQYQKKAVNGQSAKISHGFSWFRQSEPWIQS